MFAQSKRAKMNDDSDSKMSVVEDAPTKSTIPKVEGLVASGVPASVAVALHPLVIMNISDHFTRIKAQLGESSPKGFTFSFVLFLL